jgi:hypothetical protein
MHLLMACSSGLLAGFLNDAHHFAAFCGVTPQIVLRQCRDPVLPVGAWNRIHLV